jgi:ATP-binding cassette, subfamily B (MDR/TAP), member 1
MFAFIPDLSAATNAATDILKLIYYRPIIEGSQEGKTKEIPEVKGHILIEDIHFHYPTRPDNPVLRGLTLAAAPGRHIALVGQSGCGKSTIVQVLERFYTPTSGGIYVRKFLVTVYSSLTPS